ncbi:MAG: tetratricopeptide repeat protein [Acetobacteraceae bacterium]|nr:tetratricopeptide repeat protein [Acetobacteraceae bacterium]
MTSGPADPEPSQAGFDEMAAAAQAARDSGQTDLALKTYADMRRRFPERSEPLRRASDLLVEIGNFEEGDILLETAQARFPTDAGIAIEYAWAAYRRRDLPKALRRWQAVRDTFPDHPLGYTGAVVALRETGALDAADALLVTACARFPMDPSPFIEQAWMALARNDPAMAAQRWETVRTRFPDHWLGYTGGALALRDLQRLDEAEILLADAAQRFPDVYQVASEYAWLAAVRQDWNAALVRWAGALARFPEQSDPRIGTARALRELGRFEAAQAAVDQGMARFPDHPGLLLEGAMVAHDRGDWLAATLRWAVLRERQPGEVAGWRLGAAAAEHLGRFAEAASLLAEAERRSPDPAAALIQHAREALAGQRWGDASDVCNLLRQRFPDQMAGYTGGAAALRELNRLDEAAALLDAATQRFQDAAELQLARAWLAHATGDWHAAIERFLACRAQYPDQPDAVLGLARSLVGAGRFDDAAGVLAEGVQRFPGAPALAEERAALPVRRVAWQEAQQRAVADVQVPLPPPRLIPVPEPGPDDQAADPMLRDFMLGFASMGGDRFGAEFGIVQRACGAHTQDLLRRADVSIEALCAMLEARFAGVGDPANTEAFVMTDGAALSEYGIRDRRGWFTQRSFIPSDALDADTFLAAWCARLRCHAREMAEALNKGNRLFVYRMTTRKLAPAELGRLRTAMRRYGPRNALLYVSDVEPAHPDGSVTQVGEGLLMGRVTAGPPGLSPGWLPPMEAWLMTLGNAWQLLKG